MGVRQVGVAVDNCLAAGLDSLRLQQMKLYLYLTDANTEASANADANADANTDVEVDANADLIMANGANQFATKGGKSQQKKKNDVQKKNNNTISPRTLPSLYLPLCLFLLSLLLPLSPSCLPTHL